MSHWVLGATALLCLREEQSVGSLHECAAMGSRRKMQKGFSIR